MYMYIYTEGGGEAIEIKWPTEGGGPETIQRGGGEGGEEQGGRRKHHLKS